MEAARAVTPAEVSHAAGAAPQPSLILPAMISVYTDGDTHTVCMRFDDQGRPPHGSSLKLLAVFGDDESERAWAFLHELGVSARRSQRRRRVQGHILTPEPL